jgi:hypothetical protein
VRFFNAIPPQIFSKIIHNVDLQIVEPFTCPIVQVVPHLRTHVFTHALRMHALTH